MSQQNPKPLQSQLDELDELMTWFDQDDFDLDEALQKFTQGVELSERIKERLAELENKITILKRRFDQPSE
jgi:exodeoxyribonuclease VII small subunit